MLEMRGMHADSINSLDQHSEAWRRLYFFRSAVRTLWEIKGANTKIRMDPEFKNMLASQPLSEQTMLREITKKLDESAPILRKIRDRLGGHVLEGGLRDALDNMSRERLALFEVGAKIGTTHFKMAGELVAEVLGAGAPQDDCAAMIEHDMLAIAELLPIIDRMERIIFIYAVARGLV